MNQEKKEKLDKEVETIFIYITLIINDVKLNDNVKHVKISRFICFYIHQK
jgi:hypothetical protein